MTINQNDIDKLYEDGELNDYFYKQFSNSVSFDVLPEDVKKSYLQEAVFMSRIGVDDPEGQRNFFYVQYHVPDVMEELLGRLPSPKEKAQVTAVVFDKASDIKNQIDLMMAVKDAIDSLRLEIKKKAYPHVSFMAQPRPSYNINRWMDATRSIYDKVANGMEKTQAQKEVTSSWDKVERMDYEHWLKFFEEKVPEKYPNLASDKSMRLFAQQEYYEPSDQTGIYIPINRLRSELPHPIRGGDDNDDDDKKKPDINDLREVIEGHRSKVISRLNAAEKLLASIEGQQFAGDDQEEMLRMLQDLKRKVQTNNKRTVKSSLYEDYIYRAGNMFNVSGKKNAASFFYKIAQLGGLPGDPMGMPPDMGPGGGGGPPPEGDKEATKNAIKEFFNNINARVSPKDDTRKERKEQRKEDKEQAAPPTPPASMGPGMPPAGAFDLLDAKFKKLSFDNVKDQIELISNRYSSKAISKQLNIVDSILDKLDRYGMGAQDYRVIQAMDPIVDFYEGGFKKFANENIVIFAQEAPAVPAAPAPVADEELVIPPVEDVAAPPVEIEEEKNVPTAPVDQTDDVIEAALKNITIDDAIRRLEMLVGIYKKREIARQVAILDIMLDRLGLASFFPPIGESLQKSLEATQYISTRLEDVLNKLKGSIETSKADIVVEESEDDKNVKTEEIRRALKQQEDVEDERRQARRERELERAREKKREQDEELEQAAELSAPVEIAPAPAPALPVR